MHPPAPIHTRFLWKLFSGYALLVLLVAGLVGGSVAVRVQRETVSELDRRLEAVAVPLIELVKLSPSATELGRDSDLARRLDAIGRDLDVRVTLIGADGRVQSDSRSLDALGDDHGDRPEVIAALANGRGFASRTSDTLGQPMRYFAIRVGPRATPRAVLRTAAPMTTLETRLADLTRTVVGAAIAAILVALGLGFLYARRITEPVLSMAKAAAEIASGDYDQRVAVPSTDELASLARAFNTMSRELRDSMSAMTADRNKLTAILGSMVEGVIAIDRDERIVHINGVAGRLLRVEPADVGGRPIWEVSRIHEVSEVLTTCMERQSLVEREIWLAGSPDRYLRLNASPLLTQRGLAGAVLVVEDVSQLRHLETMRRDFVGNVSHELKTPITAVRGMIETLLDDPEADARTRERFLRRVTVQVERMGDLVTDLLSLSRLESGATVLEPHPLDLRLPARASANALLPVAETRGVRIDLHLPREPVEVEGEEEPLRQAISNLLDNAIKYSPRGAVVSLRLRETEREAIVEVVDQGPGIEPRHQARLFERFYRVDKARSRSLGGTGLGLAIVKHIALAHHGRVDVESAPGHGSTFCIRLPKRTLDPVDDAPRR